MRRLPPLPVLLLVLACESTSDVTTTPPDTTAAPDTEPVAETDTTEAPSGSGAAPRARYSKTDFFSAPWPSDSRRDGAGRLDLTGFPNPDALPLLDLYLTAAESELDGFSTVTPIFFAFDGALDPARLPNPVMSQAPTSPVFVVDIDPDSAHRGERIAVESRWNADPGFVYLPEDVLVLQPLYGAALREGTTYAAVVMRELQDAEGRPLTQAPETAEALAGDDPGFAALRTWLAEAAIATEKVAVATVFTTGAPTNEMAAIAAWVEDGAPAPSLVDLAKTSADGGAFHVYEGHYTSALLQHGKRPYDTEGGGFEFDASGAPKVAEVESLRVALAIPSGEMPAAGWPVVLYGHGTGGDYKSLLTPGKYSVGRDLTARGFAVMGIDQPLHGPRAPAGTDPDTASFNVFNPAAFRCNFRQGAVDVLLQARFASTLEFDGMRLDPDRIMYFGHSQGGLSGALMAPFAKRIKSFVFSGTGGGLAYTVMLRKDPVDMKAFLELALGVARSDELFIGHPVIGLLQSLADISDPLTYAPRMASEGLHVLFTSGVDDAQTPAVTSLHLAAASATPMLKPAPLPSPAHDLLGIATASRPVQGNVDGATRLMMQFADADHFVVFDDKRAGLPMLDFFTSSLVDDPPRIK